MKTLRLIRIALLAEHVFSLAAETTDSALTINDQEYFAMPGLDVILGHENLEESHQGGVIVIQNGYRTASNGDLRLEPAPGQWQPTAAAVGQREVDRPVQEIRMRMKFPDEKKDRTGFNPVRYPELKLDYVVKVRAEGNAFRITVDLAEPLPADWVGQVGFNLDLFPERLFGKSYQLGSQFGQFPRQPAGNVVGIDGGAVPVPFAEGEKLVVAPESDEQRMTIESLHGGKLLLLDGRMQHQDSTFVVRSLVPANATKAAIEWIVTPHAIPNWKSTPVIQISQIGYHPRQPKVAVIELDGQQSAFEPVTLFRATAGGLEKILERPAKNWGRYLRHRYLQFDFSDVKEPGIYVLGYGAERSSLFPIGEAVFRREVWQPTMEYFLPVQMCHMRVVEGSRVWHGLCHTDDALMAPTNHNHFDGYAQGPSTLCKYQPGDHVPGLDHGGWHDAGDYDMRVESQADTIHGLALGWELFHPTIDTTTVDQEHRLVLIHQPDRKPDFLQQIEHGALTIVGGYNALGRPYRGIQSVALHLYTLLGDVVNETDNQIFHDSGSVSAQKILAQAAHDGSFAEPTIGNLPPLGFAGSADDRWVFTDNYVSWRDSKIPGALAAASRVLKGFNDPLAHDCLRIAEELWNQQNESEWSPFRLETAIELYQATGNKKYAAEIVRLADVIVASVKFTGWLGARAIPLVNDPAFTGKIKTALRDYRTQLEKLTGETPYGVLYKPGAGWVPHSGSGWEIERFGVHQYFLHKGAPEIFPENTMLNAINFILGCHPGANPSSFVSGVGTKSLIPAYGGNRADWSYVPGGIAPGTAMIKPDHFELREWPFSWQQTEYCLGEQTTDYVFLILAADDLLDHRP